MLILKVLGRYLGATWIIFTCNVKEVLGIADKPYVIEGISGEIMRQLLTTLGVKEE